MKVHLIGLIGRTGQQVYQNCGPHEQDYSVPGAEFVYPSSAKLGKSNFGHETEVAVWFTTSGTIKKRHFGRPKCTIEYNKCMK